MNTSPENSDAENRGFSPPIVRPRPAQDADDFQLHLEDGLKSGSESESDPALEPFADTLTVVASVPPAAPSPPPAPHGPAPATLAALAAPAPGNANPNANANPAGRTRTPNNPATNQHQHQHQLPRLPGYDVLRVLGRGGMGVVYVAQQLKLCRLVALKMVLADIRNDPDFSQRFTREAESVARLRHPNIVQILDFGDYEGTPFYVMEYIRGGNLANRLNGKPFPAAVAARFLLTVTQGLDAIHRRGTIHLDLKPANILIDGDPDHALDRTIPKIGDFGLAQRTDLPRRRTKTESSSDSSDGSGEKVLGSPTYIAPEQATAKHELTGVRADLYSLGVILFELLVGQPPLRGTSPMHTLQMVVYETPPSPRKFVPDLPRDLETICLKCLEKDPSRRYESAAALADDLANFLAGRPIVARKVHFLERTWRWFQRNMLVCILTALAVSGWLTALVIAAMKGVFS